MSKPRYSMWTIYRGSPALLLANMHAHVLLLSLHLHVHHGRSRRWPGLEKEVVAIDAL